MSELEDLRDHARRVLKGSHRPDCARSSRLERMPGRWSRERSCEGAHSHEPHEWTEVWRDLELAWNCPGFCVECLTGAERLLWQQIADEVDVYLTTSEDEGLFS